jgi:hypothetical protein
MSRRKRLHRKLYLRKTDSGKPVMDWPRAKVLGTGKWLGTGAGVGKTVTLPKVGT